MKQKFTRKTWYFFFLAAAGATMLNALAVLAGADYSFLEMCAFCMEAIATLFLAAQKGAPAKEKRGYFAVFLLLMGSYLFGGWLGYFCAALAWPALLLLEYQRGAAVARPMQLVGGAEALHLLLLLAVTYGGVTGLRFWANLLWLLLACARGWAALTLYKVQEDDV